VQAVYFIFIDIDAGNFHAEFSKTGSGDKSDVSGADNSNMHKLFQILNLLKIQFIIKEQNFAGHVINLRDPHCFLLAFKQQKASRRVLPN
jgi:hypothetical protein